MITSFTGDHGFLSNFHEASFWMPAATMVFHHPAHSPDRFWFNSAEHAFQAHKATSREEMLRVMNAPSPYQAKRTGRVITCRSDWEQAKRGVMLQVLLAKFSYLGHLRDQLAATSTEVLVEGNDWGDTYWGAVGPDHAKFNMHRLPVWSDPGLDGTDTVIFTGRNWLGRELMMVREVLGD